MKEWNMAKSAPQLATMDTGAQRVLKSPTRYFWKDKEVQMINAGVAARRHAIISISGKTLEIPKSEIICRNAE